MKYLGGKGKNGLGLKIVETIEPWRAPGKLWVDVFCGALNVIRHVRGPRLALDACQPLVTTLRASIGGWIPPDHLTEETYNQIKANPDPWDPLTAFAMFGCTFNGSWGGKFAGISWDKTNKYWKNVAKESRNGLLEKAQDCRGLDVCCLDYRKIPQPPPGIIMYCDPPYRWTTGYKGVPPFDSDHFWNVAHWWTYCGALVFVSEGEGAEAPADWVVFRDWQVKANLSRHKGTRIERLYVHQSSPMARGLNA